MDNRTNDLPPVTITPAKIVVRHPGGREEVLLVEVGGVIHLPAGTTILAYAPSELVGELVIPSPSSGGPEEPPLPVSGG